MHVETIGTIETIIDSGMPPGEAAGESPRVRLARLHHVMELLPRLLARVVQVESDGELRRPAVEALVDLELGDRRVCDLWLQACAAVGLFSDSVRAGEPPASVASAIERVEERASASSGAALAASVVLVERLASAACELHRELSDDLAAGPGIAGLEEVAFRLEPRRRSLRASLATVVERDADAAEQALDAAQAAGRAVDGGITRR